MDERKSILQKIKALERMDISKLLKLLKISMIKTIRNFRVNTFKQIYDSTD